MSEFRLLFSSDDLGRVRLAGPPDVFEKLLSAGHHRQFRSGSEWAGWTGTTEQIDSRTGSTQCLVPVPSDHHNIALRPALEFINSITAAGRDVLAQRMAGDGVEALLCGLHPDIDWQHPMLIIGGLDAADHCMADCRQKFHRTGNGADFQIFPLNGRGLILVPTAFSAELCLCLPDDDQQQPAILFLPVEIDPVPSAPARSAIDPLKELLGSTRSWVLHTLAETTHTTSTLARRIGISIGSASEHASALRSAGLVSSTRDKNSVRHHATPLGIALVRQARTTTTGFLTLPDVGRVAARVPAAI